MTRGSWHMVIAISGLLLCWAFAFGYNAGKKHREKQYSFTFNSNILEADNLYIDPNVDPKYQELRERGYRWEDTRGWIKK